MIKFSMPPDIFERIADEFFLSDIYDANILLMERKENRLDLVKLEWTYFGMWGDFIYLSFFFNLVRFLFWRNLLISFYFPCSVPVYISYAHVYTLITR